ncbi:glucose-1-phosphate cytidylyltransferase [Methylophilaceae bacterium]|nr:glucose-1-phosphate cytidylyltransferase [Methylophilaceae bacterium]
MKVLILAGGTGTRLAEETVIKPKPMLEIGTKPILWHIMKIYDTYGFDEFVILLGYKGYLIKEYFANYFLHLSDVTINLKDNSITYHKKSKESWKITLIDTGLNAMTGSRIKYAKEFIDDDYFLLTYGDGLANIDMDEQLKFHKSHYGIMTMTAVQPDGRFGTFEHEVNSTKVTQFTEKPRGEGSWINGGFFVCNTEIFEYIDDGDQTIFEQQPMQNLAKDGQLHVFYHHGFWKCMDTMKDKNDLNFLWNNNSAPWKIWK